MYDILHGRPVDGHMWVGNRLTTRCRRGDHEFDDIMHTARRKLESRGESVFAVQKLSSERASWIQWKMTSKAGVNFLQTNGKEF